MSVALSVALAVTVAAVVASRVAVGLVDVALAGRRVRRRREARAAEAAGIAAAAQRWVLTPAALGGPAARPGVLPVVTFDTLGLPHDPSRPDLRRTAAGTYRLIAVAPCAALDGCAALVGEASPAAGLVVVGTGETPGDAVAVVVLGPLVQVRLPTVPWAWIRALTTPLADPLQPAAPVPVVAHAPAVPPVPRRQRRPAWRPALLASTVPARHRPPAPRAPRSRADRTPAGSRGSPHGPPTPAP